MFDYGTGLHKLGREQVEFGANFLGIVVPYESRICEFIYFVLEFLSQIDVLLEK